MISVHPPTLGKYELDVDVFFEDNKFDVASTEVNVRLPDRNPDRFVVSRDGMPYGVLIVAMDLNTLSKADISGSAVYSGYKWPVAINAASMQFSLQTGRGESPVDFDPKAGVIIARSLGQAVLTVRFGGFERKVCINVVQNARGGAYSTCPHVVPGGLKWTSAEWGPPPKPVGPKAPKPVLER